MSIQFVVKGKGWIAGKSKALKVPQVLINVAYEDNILVKLAPDKRGVYESTLEKLFAAKEKDILKMAEAKMRGTLGSADAAFEKEPEKAQPWVARAQSELAEVCRDIERGMLSACTVSVGAAYKTAMNGAVLVAKVAPQAQAKIQGKLLLTDDASSEIDADAGLAEAAGKALASLVYPLQDEAEGVTADAKAAAPMLDKAIKESNILSKTMREQAKKPTPAGATLIKTTAASVHKNLQTLEKLLEASQMKIRTIKTKLVTLDGQAKEWKNAGISSGIHLCASDAQDITALLSSFHGVKPIADQLAKPFDGKTIPDFGKLLTTLNRLHDPRPSHELTAHLTKLGDLVADAAKE